MSTTPSATPNNWSTPSTARNPAAEFTVGRGQSWCVVSSAEEGDSHVTAFAPEVGNAEAGRVVVTRHWTDADWTPPPPVAGPPGTQQFLSAAVFHRGDRQPLAGYAVRYRILDGPPALFLPSQTTETTVVTNSTGVAPVVVAQTAPQPGRNRIGVEVLRPGRRAPRRRRDARRLAGAGRVAVRR